MKKKKRQSRHEFDGAIPNIMNGKMEKSDGKYEFDGFLYNLAHKKSHDILSTKD